METECVDLDDIAERERTQVFDDPKSVLLGLDAEETIPPHRHPGRTILFHVLAGSIELTIDEESHDLDTGQVARFSGDRDISPTATTDARALLVFVPRD